MNTKPYWRTETRVELNAEPFVDWFQADPEAEVRALWEERARESGLPLGKTTVEIRPATPEETKAISQ